MAKQPGRSGRPISRKPRPDPRAGGDGPPVPAQIPKRPTLSSVRDAAADCRACDLHRRATQTVFGEGPATRGRDAYRRAARRLGGSRGTSLRGPRGQIARPGARGVGDRPPAWLCDQRRETFHVGAARHAAHSREAERRRDRRVPAMARDRNRPDQAARARVSRGDGGGGLARTIVQGVAPARNVRPIAARPGDRPSVADPPGTGRREPAGRDAAARDGSQNGGSRARVGDFDD